MADAAHALGFEIMIAAMVASSLAMAPAMLLAPEPASSTSMAPCCCARSRWRLRYDGSLVYPPEAALWGDRQPAARQHSELRPTGLRSHNVISALPVRA